MTDAGTSKISQMMNSPEYEGIRKAAEEAAEVALSRVMELQGKPTSEERRAPSGGGHGCFSIFSVVVTRAAADEQ